VSGDSAIADSASADSVTEDSVSVDSVTEDSGIEGTDVAPGSPALRIVSGNPTPEEIAAVTVVLTLVAAPSGAARSEQIRQSGGWADPSLRLRRMIPAGPGAWRAAVGR
jgi:hypothetical protein